MLNERDKDYYSRRATEERRAAEIATDECARRSHIQLAENYERLAEKGYFSEDVLSRPALATAR